MSNLSHDDKVKLLKFEMDEARWIHEEIIRPHLYSWVDKVITNVVEYKKYGMIGRLFHFCVEYFYISKFLSIKIKRNRHQTMLTGKGYRPGTRKMRLDRIGSKVYMKGKEVATKSFPVGIIQ